MKELMVTLLVLSCTGMVWAQQNEGSGFRPNGGSSNSGSAFGRSSDPGSSIPTVPIVNDESATARRGQGGQVGQGGLRAGRQGNGRSRGAFSTPSANERGEAPSETSRILDSNRPVQDSFQPGSTGLPASNPLLSTSRVSTPSEKPLYLGLPPQAMNVLLSKGRVVAAVNDPNHGKIKISDQNTPKAGPTRKIQPRLVDGSLVFTFTQADIDFIERGSLQFEVPPELKDRYTSATIEVPEVLNRISQASAKPTQNNSSFQADDSRWKRPGQITARQPIQPRRQLTGEDVAIEGRIALVEARLETEARLEAITAQQYHTFAVAVKAASKAFAEADNERALALLATIDLDLSMLKKASQSAQDLAEPVDQKIAVRFSKLTPASEGTQAEIREDLKQRVAVLFDAKIEAREKALEELAARIASARKKLRDRVENRDSIIDRRVKKLLKE